MFLAVVDKYKERKRKNLIPARHGIYGIFVFGCHTIASQVAYNALTTKVYKLILKIQLVLVLKNGLDCSVRALIVAMSTDSYFCLFCPLLTLFACPAVRRNCAFLSRSGRGL